MSVKVTINDREVRNPVARFLITLAGLVIFVLFFMLVFFLFLPFVWFMTLSIVLALLVLIAVSPKLFSQYRVILIERKSPKDHK